MKIRFSKGDTQYAFSYWYFVSKIIYAAQRIIRSQLSCIWKLKLYCHGFLILLSSQDPFQFYDVESCFCNLGLCLAEVSNMCPLNSHSCKQRKGVPLFLQIILYLENYPVCYEVAHGFPVLSHMHFILAASEFKSMKLSADLWLWATYFDWLFIQVSSCCS